MVSDPRGGSDPCGGSMSARRLGVSLFLSSLSRPPTQLYSLSADKCYFSVHTFLSLVQNIWWLSEPTPLLAKSLMYRQTSFVEYFIFYREVLPTDLHLSRVCI